MEIGTEISRKIRMAIKGKLQELGAYVDEELPDYIMVMVANKKSQEQMTDDLSLFLGNNTARFTTWLQGVLEKLRTVTPGSNSLKASEAIIFNSTMPPLKSHSREEPWREAERHHPGAPAPTSQVPPTSSDRASTEAMVAARLTSAVKPLQDSGPSEAVIDIKLDVDDPFTDDFSYGSESSLQSRKNPPEASMAKGPRPTAQIYRPPGSSQTTYRPEEHRSEQRALHRPPQGAALQPKPSSSYTTRAIATTRPYNAQESGRAEDPYRPSPASDRASRAQEQVDLSRKRRIPVVSSVVKVTRMAEDFVEEEDDDEEEDVSRVSGVPSSVSVPARPERRPTLPPYKQANKNLILKAISEAQESITKTTSYPTVPPKQMVPVAPHAHLISEEELILMKSRASMLRYQGEPEETPAPMRSRAAMLRRLGPVPAEVPVTSRVLHHQREPEDIPVVVSGRASRLRLQEKPEEIPVLITGRTSVVRHQTEPEATPVLETRPVTDRRMDVLSRLQPEPMELTAPPGQDVQEAETLHPADSRSFIIKGVKCSRNSPLQTQTPGDSLLQPGRLIQPRESQAPERPASPKFIVTLDGVPSPLGFRMDEEMEEEPMAYEEEGDLYPESFSQSPALEPDHFTQPNVQESHSSESAAAPAKTKIPERCKYWPACKNAESCAYHHPTTVCKSFPKCRFADKCFFIHPNCKFDAKCTKADCPYTHASKRATAAPANSAPVAKPPGKVQCRYFPSCKNTECTFFHPKHCRFSNQCSRADCEFYHPAAAVPPRSALTWTRPPASDADTVVVSGV